MFEASNDRGRQFPGWLLPAARSRPLSITLWAGTGPATFHTLHCCCFRVLRSHFTSSHQLLLGWRRPAAGEKDVEKYVALLPRAPSLDMGKVPAASLTVLFPPTVDGPSSAPGWGGGRERGGDFLSVSPSLSTVLRKKR